MTDSRLNLRGVKIIVLTFVVSVLLGCSNQNIISQTEDDVPFVSAEGEAGVSSSADAGTETGILNVSELFTDRDKEVGYDESSSVRVTLADGASSADSDSVRIDGNTITITREGTYLISGSLSDGQLVVEDGDKTQKVQLVLDGVSISNDSSAAIYVKQADKVFITTAKDTENILSASGEFEAIDDNNIDGAIFSKDDLTLNGMGRLTVLCNYGHGIVGKDDLVITSGAYDITVSAHGISGKNSVRIENGDITVSAGKDGIHSENNDDESLGFIYIGGGNYNIIAEGDGIDAQTILQVDGGTITIHKSYEGFEGQSVDILGGVITIIASDDGINAAGGNDGSGSMGDRNQFKADENCYINIGGGTVKISALGDGIDSNGNLMISGGIVEVNGPVSGGDGSIDYNGTAVINGGTFWAAGSSAMAQGFGSDSAQSSIMYFLETGALAGSTVMLTDANGAALIEFTPENEFECIIISIPELEQGNSYILLVNESEYQIELSENNYTNGSGFPGGGRPQGGASGRRDFGEARPEGAKADRKNKE